MVSNSTAPEGTITSLPVKKGKGAPDTFKGDFRDIGSFIDHFETLCKEKNVVGDKYKCRGLVRYCSREVRETLEGLKSYLDKDYPSFKRDFIYHYDKDRETQRYKLKDLHALVRKWREKKIGNLETFKKYHLKYLRVGGWLLKNKKITDLKHRKWFWGGLPKKFRKKVEGQMRIADPQLNVKDPFPVDSIVAAAKNLYDRERFDEDELTLYLGRGDDDESSDSESESGSDSSSEESEEEDSDNESEEEMPKKKKYRKRKGEKKKSGKKGRHAGENRNGQTDEEEIDNLVEKMIGLDISEPTYLAISST